MHSMQGLSGGAVGLTDRDGEDEKDIKHSARTRSWQTPPAE